MNIGLIDVDSHNFPNLALMKISTYHKDKGDQVSWYDNLVGLVEEYDVVYMSKVFTNLYTQDYIYPIFAKEVIKGGYGYDNYELPFTDYETQFPDYSIYYEIYPQFRKTAFGYLTRGCPRNCSFCIVSGYEGRKTKQVANINNFYDPNIHKEIRLLDANILAHKDLSVFKQLQDSKAYIHFTGGVDIRFLNKNQFDYILHIGALRGGRNFSKNDFYKVNVNATEQLAVYALTHHSNFIFCSSVGVFGGIPKYYNDIDNLNIYNKKFDIILKNLIFNENGLLKREGFDLVADEFGRNYQTYFSILQSIAVGKTKTSEISNNTGIAVGTLSQYLEKLVFYYKLIDRRMPLLDEKTKKSRYKLNDQFLTFWFRYLYKNWSMAELNNFEPIILHVKKNISAFYGITFETIIKESIVNKQIINFPIKIVENIGSWWSRQEAEIDILAVNKEKKLYTITNNLTN